MKALSIKQPWANLIASGEKTVETRLWKTDYRGPLLICSSKQPDIAPAGKAIALVQLVDCRPMSVLDEGAAKCRKYDGAIAWVLADVRRIRPFSVQGRIGLFEIGVTEEELIDFDAP